MTFTEAKQKFDQEFGNSAKTEYKCFLPVHLNTDDNATIKNNKGEPNEQYYKWQFLYSIVQSGLFAKDYIGTEVQFPKGSKSSAPIKIDAAIFDDKSWFEKYKDYHTNYNNDSLDWLRKHLMVVIEFKKEGNENIADVWDKQLKAYLKESERGFCLGILYDRERLYLFRNYNDKFLRYSEEFNTKGENSQTKDLSLHLPDKYTNLPSFDDLLKWTKPETIDRSKKTINDLDIISGIHSKQINDVMSCILQTMDKVGMVNQTGFVILIQILALKIYDEKRNEGKFKNYLDFYITDEEKNFKDLNDQSLQNFLGRINKLRNEAKAKYHQILQNDVLKTTDKNHIKVLIEVVYQFQDYSFVRSHKTDLYQLIFYRFAQAFAKDRYAQFLTPLPIIDFLVNIVNPRRGETIIDPTVGIGDFLSVAYVNSGRTLDDSDIYGIDIDTQMVMLATLNMLLNGDGNAKIEAVTGYGSLLSKFSHKGEIIELIPSKNKEGNWDERADEKELKKFDIVLTNPPFGEDRAFVPKNDNDLKMIQCYELWHLYNGKNAEKGKIDLGVIFLENAYRILKENGRMGIVLSNSIASIDTHKIAREWLMDKMRIVAIFDLPANVFAETGVNTTLIVAYKPNEKELSKLKQENYQVFINNIEKVGYEIKTSKRVKYFSPIYKINYETFEIEIDKDGKLLLDEDFTETINEFRKWCLTQEETLRKLFIGDKK